MGRPLHLKNDLCNQPLLMTTTISMSSQVSNCQKGGQSSLERLQAGGNSQVEQRSCRYWGKMVNQ